MNTRGTSKRTINLIQVALGILCFSVKCTAQDSSRVERNPIDSLPPYVERITYFGQRAEWSHDGKRILFIEKTYGDAFEVDLETRHIKPITHHFYHGGFTRALYLSNGDILLSGCTSFDAENPHLNRREKAELWVLDKSLIRPPMRLGAKCSEGPAVSRNRLHIAWTQVAAQYPDQMAAGTSRIYEADIVYEDGAPKLANQRLVIDSRDLPFRCTMETQNFRPPHEKEIVFSAYGYQSTDVCGVDLLTKKVTNYSVRVGKRSLTRPAPSKRTTVTSPAASIPSASKS